MKFETEVIQDTPLPLTSITIHVQSLTIMMMLQQHYHLTSLCIL